MTDLEARIKAVLVGADMTAGTILFTTGNDITISARCGMALMDARDGVYDPSGPHGIEQWALIALADALDQVEEDHCMLAIVGDRDRAVDVLTTLMPYAMAWQNRHG